MTSARRNRFETALALAAMAAGLAAGARADDADALVGRSLFRRLWVPAPTRTDAADGLGPLFNARSCTGCHLDAGPSRVRRDVDRAAAVIDGAVFRVAGPGGARHPWYGRQLQTGSVPGLEAEARARLEIAPSGVTPAVTLTGPPLGDGFHLGARIAPPLRGAALLDRVDEAAVLARASPEAQQRLGLAGRARLIAGAEGKSRLGRYGWKASQPDLASQTADAFAIDLGLSSPLRPEPRGDCTPAQTACLDMPDGESPAFDGREISGAMLDMVLAYLGSLAPPRRAAQENHGGAIFAATGCAACHAPDMPAKDGGSVAVFTDLLLHDMGPDLDDGLAEPGVPSSLWRTAPLIDLVTARAARRYLHDGRAASVAEAVSWHGGEAAPARERFGRLSEVDRARLVSYLEGR